MAEGVPLKRRGAGRVIGLGVLAATLATVAAAKPWFTADLDLASLPGVPVTDTRIDMPLALALGLVVLAGWAAALVSRGRLRTALVALALLAQAGVLACVVAAPFTLPGDLRERIDGSSDLSVSLTSWYVVAALGSLLATATLAAALRALDRWPTMSSRYDAPTGVPTSEPTDVPAAGLAAGVDDLALWKALDEGHDPTAR